uniref:Uncharacterized protein n=1 Tax=Kwoniella bestiolae CBS 10118 TaxID=1296100 RepID=A0A1B9G9L2_9TREE|nr:hypothetical protein I302_02563 [Kwoniella bestiolae CBS 10118]OCF27718.1 hypothetical protein I302_02563 [Kwoniella bestiolae CBS 10118]
MFDYCRDWNVIEQRRDGEAYLVQICFSAYAAAGTWQANCWQQKFLPLSVGVLEAAKRKRRNENRGTGIALELKRLGEMVANEPLEPKAQLAIRMETKAIRTL